MVPSGKGHLVPLPLSAPAVSEHDAAVRRQLVGAFEPWVGWAIVNEGLLCFSQNGQSLTFVTKAQAEQVLRDVGSPAGYEVVQVITADRESATRTLV